MGAAEFGTLTELFLKAVERHNKPDSFLHKVKGRYLPLSSREALEWVAAFADVLERLGIQAGDRVAILSENCLEWALTDYAVLGLDAITVPIYPTFFAHDVEWILRDSASKAIVVSTEEQLGKVLKVRPGLPELKLIVAIDPPARAVSDVLVWNEAVASTLRSGTSTVDAFRARALQVKPEDTASILYTSGTMGRPKGVVLTHSNIVSNILASLDFFPLSRHDVGISFLPLSHIYERMLDYTSLWRGVSVAYSERHEELPRDLREVRPTVFPVVPRVLEKIHDRVMEVVHQASPGRQKLFSWAVEVGKRYSPYRLEGRTPPLALRAQHALADRLVFSKVRAQLGGRVRLILSGAAPLARELAEFFFAVGLPVYEGYGLTETSPVITVNRPGAVKLGTVGRAIPGVEIKLGEEVAVEDQTVGSEILVRGPNVTPGYYHLEEENRAAFVDGWFKTGDLGRIDADGFLTITGRKKNLFKTSGGKYVAPDRLESLFQGHPYVFQIVVIGEGRKFVGALVVPHFDRLEAWAQTRRLTFPSREELVANPEVLEFLQQQVDQATSGLPPHEKIRQIVLLPREFTTDSGELSATLKIKRRVVEERYRDQIEEMFRRHAPAQVSSI